MTKLIYSERSTLKALRKGYDVDKLGKTKEIRHIKVKPNNTTRVRTSLKWNDIYNDNFLINSFADEVWHKGKKAILLREIFHLPSFSQYYARQVESIDNWYVQHLILKWLCNLNSVCCFFNHFKIERILILLILK